MCVCVCARARPDQYELINRRRQLEGPWGWQTHTWCTHTHTQPLFVFHPQLLSLSSLTPLPMSLSSCLSLFVSFSHKHTNYLTIFPFTLLRLQSYMSLPNFFCSFSLPPLLLLSESKIRFILLVRIVKAGCMMD